MTSVWQSTLLSAWDFATQGYVLKVLCGEGIDCHYLRWKEEQKFILKVKFLFKVFD